MGLRVFVTRELFPFTAGGIGRVVANILATSSADELASSAIVFIGSELEAASFNAVYPKVVFLAVHGRMYRLLDEQGRLYPPMESFTTSWLHWESILALQALRRLKELHGDLDYVEFVDWGAAGFATVQEKRLGQEFQKTTIAVRLHTTDSVLAAFEPRHHDVHGLALYDLERKALADCDLIVGQLEPVSEAMRLFYGFAPEDWAPRAVIHAPPVLLDAAPIASRSVRLDAETPLVFSSKLQDIKRPDVFVNGCVQFMLANPGYEGKAYFLAHAFDSGYQTSIQKMIPDALEGRFVFLRGLTGLAREQFIARSVCVFPSPWESFCLAAYEASLSGAVCVLNSRNAAFGDGTPWVHGMNCRKFDGSAASLAATLEQLFVAAGEHGCQPVEVPEDPAPWSRPVPSPHAATGIDAITVVVLNRDAGAGLFTSLDSIVASTHPLIEVLVVDDASSDPVSAVTLAQIEQLAEPSVRVRRLSIPRGNGGAWNAALCDVRTPLVSFLEAGCLLAPDFLGRAAMALRANPSHSAVTGPHVIAEGLEDVARGNSTMPANFWVVHGEARASGTYQNRFASDALVMRTSVATSLGFDETVGDLALWDMLHRATADGMRTLVASDVSAVRTPAAIERSAGNPVPGDRRPPPVVLMRGKQVTLSRLVLPSYAFLTPASAGMPYGAGAADVLELERRYVELRSSEAVRLALFIAESIRRIAPWALAPLRKTMDALVRLRRR